MVNENGLKRHRRDQGDAEEEEQGEYIRDLEK